MNLKSGCSCPRVARTHRKILVAAITLGTIATAQAGTMNEWSTVVNGVAAAASFRNDQNGDGRYTVDDRAISGPPVRKRLSAMVYLAVHDALNSIDPRYESYNILPGAAPGASDDAAIAEAVYQILKVEAPGSVDEYTDPARELYQETVGSPACDVPGTPCKLGRDAGAAAAKAILDQRWNRDRSISTDGSRATVPLYSAPLVPGAYQPTPATTPAGAANIVPAFEQWANVKPFALNTASQFRSGGADFLDMTSAAFADDYDEVKRIGSLAAGPQDRDAAQTETVAFWAVSAAAWVDIASKIAMERGLDARDQARLLAVLSMALSDSTVKVMETKYRYAFWRPITAIRALEDPNWNSLLASPAYPDYSSGASMNGGVATEILRRHFGTDNVAFSFTATTKPAGHPHLPNPPYTREFASLSEAAHSVARSRVYAGIHFWSACKVALEQGGQIGRHVYEHNLRPLK